MSALLGLLVSDDLIFISRIVGTAKDLGFLVESVRSIAGLQAAGKSPALVLVDLANPGLAIGEVIGWLKANVSPPPYVVAYGSHVDTATLKKAREAGCDLVLPRSKFVEDLPRALPGWFAGTPH